MGGRVVSVVVPVYNAGIHLREALSSVLNQTHPEIDLIVIDDGSSDDSGDVAAEFGCRIRYRYQANSGVGAARNAGVRLAVGRYLSFLDADDRMMPECLEKLVSVLESRPEIDMVFAHINEFLSPELAGQQREGLRKPFQKVSGRLPATMLIRRQAFLSVGGFSTNRRIPEALEWYGRARSKGLSYSVVADVLWERRLRPGSRAGEVNHKAQLPTLLKQTLDRNRCAPAS